MPRRSGSSRGQSDWIALAHPYDHHLNSAQPMWVSAGATAGPTPLDVHVHRGMDVGLLVSGRIEQLCGDLTLRPEAGDVWLGAMWEPHGWRILDSDTSLVIWCFLPQVIEGGIGGYGSFLNMFTVPPRQRPRVSSPEMRRHMLSIAAEMIAEFEQRRPGWEAAMQLGLIRVLFELAREWRPAGGAEQRPSVRANQIALITPALGLAHEALERRVTPTEAAAACGLSVSWFHQVFRQTMGLTFGRFCQRLRLASAARQLLTTDMSVEAIADHLGFANASHLHRCFVA